MSVMNHPDRLFPIDSTQRNIARNLYNHIKDLPIISPHGHTDPKWFAQNQNFKNATSLLLTPDHYILRMLYSQGISLEELGRGKDESDLAVMRSAWKIFGKNFHLFDGTPSSIWMNSVFSEVFGIEEELTGESADIFFDNINEKLASDEFKPNALMKRFNIELIATTDEAIDTLEHHKVIRSNGEVNVIPTFRPDRLTDPTHEDFRNHIDILSEKSDENIFKISGFFKALRERREYFKSLGATATDHGHPSARTLYLSTDELQKLFDLALKGNIDETQAERFRAGMLFEMAKMSCDDGLVMQIHPGPFRNHNRELFEKFGRDIGADIPRSTEYVENLKPLLDHFGNHKELKIILFTLDETRYSTELAPLAGHYPVIKLGPAWWFHDSPEGMMRYRRMVTETGGFYNTVGFNDDTRAFLSIPARHDVARRMDAGFISELLLQKRISEKSAYRLMEDLTYNLAKNGYNL